MRCCLCEVSRKVKSIEAESRLMVSWGWGWGLGGCRVMAKGYRVSFWGDEKFQKWILVMDAQL